MTTRLRFLPTFFIVLAIAFIALAAMRLRSYGNVDAVGPGATATGAPPIPTAPSYRTQPDQNETLAAAAQANGTMAPRGRAPLPVIRDPEPEPLLAARSASSARVAHVAPASAGVGTRPSPPPQQSPASRILPPAVQAVTSGSNPSAGPGSSSPAPASATETRAAEAEKDPSSDTAAPLLTSVEFNPPVIRDGEHTNLYVTATDDLSGMRSVSGTVVSPSGALTGFSLQRQVETDRYLGKIEVPAESADGLWKITFMSLVDNASNAAYLNQSALPPTASFRVTSSRPDTSGPTLKAIWIDRVALRGGERTTVNVQVEDEQTGVRLVSGVFQSPSKLARIGFGCQQRGDVWQCQLVAPTCLDCGDWQLEQIQLQDKANNTTTIRIDNPLVAAARVNILSDQCDNTPPILQAVLFDRTVVNNIEDSKVTVTMTATDNFCGVESISGYVVPDRGPAQTREPFSLRPSSNPSTWTGEITIRRLAAKGVWKINWLQVVDKGKNLRGYSAMEPVLASATFVVQ